ncbi:MAG: hypothetical protein H6Q68_4000, partial [Firmicutes bacterium]|nr:hypothetical protein [Bacillota bacterium]
MNNLDKTPTRDVAIPVGTEKMTRFRW